MSRRIQIFFQLTLLILCVDLDAYAQGSVGGNSSNSGSKSPISADSLQAVPAAKKSQLGSFQYDLYEAETKLKNASANRFYYRTPTQKDGTFIAFHNLEKPIECNGDLLARRYRLIMNQYDSLEDLCWRRSSGAGTITLTDPKALLFKTRNVDATSLIYIKSELDLRREETKRKIDEVNQRAQIIDELNQRYKYVGRNRLDCIALGPFISCE